MNDLNLYYIENNQIKDINLTELLQKYTNTEIAKQLNIPHTAIGKFINKQIKQSNNFFLNKEDCINYLHILLKLNESTFDKIDNIYVCSVCGNTKKYLSDLTSINFKCNHGDEPYKTDIIYTTKFVRIDSNTSQCKTCNTIIHKTYNNVVNNNYSCYNCDIQNIQNDVLNEANKRLVKYGLHVEPCRGSTYNYVVQCSKHRESYIYNISNLQKLNKSPCTQCKSEHLSNYIDITKYNISKYTTYRNIEIQCKHCNEAFTTSEISIFNNTVKCNSPKCRKEYFNNKYVELPNYLVIQDYKNSGEYHVNCKKCNTNFISYNVGKTNKCMNCESHNSKEELIISEWVKEIYPDVEIIINRKYKDISELDLYFPEYKFAIEINGVAFHSTPDVYHRILPTNKHVIKYELCKKYGIQLLQITDYDIANKLDLIKSMITNKLHKTQNKIYARKCKIKPVTIGESRRFLEDNHIQGKIDSKFKLGLFYNNQLVAYISFSKATNKDILEWDLTRYCQIKYTNVVGGFTKLLQYFIKNYSNNENIITFSDNMYSNGDVYINNGFVLQHELPIDYKYFDGNTKHALLYKSNFMKSKIQANKNMKYDNTLVERELMELNGYSRYYDAGKIKWIYKGTK